MVRVSDVTQFQSYQAEDIYALPDYCTKLAGQLFEPPITEGERSKEARMVRMEKWDDVRIFGLFSHNVRSHHLKNPDQLPFQEVGAGPEEVEGSEGEKIPYGLLLASGQIPLPCARAELNRYYFQVMNDLIYGWKKPEDSDCEQPDEIEGCHLFVKWPKNFCEDVIIRFLASRLGVEQHIRCEMGQHHGFRLDPVGQINLWVRKTAVEQVVDKLGLDLPLS